MNASDKWDEQERLDALVLKYIGLWDPEVDKVLSKKVRKDTASFIISHIIYKYARVKGIDYSNKKEFDKICKSVVPSKYSQSDELQEDFWVFAVTNYGVDLNRKDDNIYEIRKVPDKEFDIILNYLKGDISAEEYKKQVGQARYPTLNDKKLAIHFDILEQMERLERKEYDNLPAHPKAVSRIKKHIEGYDDAPDTYILTRFFVYEAAYKKGWDEAEIEKVLDEQVKEMVKEGDISSKEYEKIKKIVKRETDKKVK